MSFYIDNFIEIKDNKDMEDFLLSVGEFHDGVIKEVHIQNSAFVQEDLSMLYDFKYDVRLLIQRQWDNPSAVEILLGNVYEMKFDEPGCIWSSTGSIALINDVIKIILNIDNAYFKCSKMFWRNASDWMGRQSRFGEYLSIDSLYPYEILEDGWVICNNCFEAWNPGQNSVIQCPKCSGMNYNVLSKKPDIL